MGRMPQELADGSLEPFDFVLLVFFLVPFNCGILFHAFTLHGKPQSAEGKHWHKSCYSLPKKVQKNN
jgi:hypothetical protein